MQDDVRRAALDPAHVEQHDGAYYVVGTRVSLDSIVYSFLEGQTAESIGQAFPVLSLEQVYGAITFYLGHREEVDRYLETQHRDFQAKRQAARDTDPMFYQRLAAARRNVPAT